MASATTKRLTVGQLARRARLSRSALLHYEGLGLLSPAGRSPAGYRLYGEREIERLGLIRCYREAGLPMAAIAELLGGARGDPARILERHLLELNGSIARLREQQRRVARLLGQPGLLLKSRAMTKERWVGVLRRAGLDEADMARWHQVFEAEAPEAHQDFLESLAIPAEEISRIREASRL
jgi:MerR family transcriptional regulator, thiopeptide resistance regulator